MRTPRKIAVAALAMSLVACGGGDGQAELEQRVAELEGQLAAETTAQPSTTTEVRATTTRQTTTTAPTTTGTFFSSDFAWEGVTFGDIAAWRDGAIPEGLMTAILSCEGAILNLGAAGDIVARAGLEVFGIAVAVDDGSATVVEASEAFTEYANASAFVRDLATFVRDDLNEDAMGPGHDFANEITEAAESIVFPAITIGLLAYDAEDGTYDDEIFQSMAPDLSDGIVQLLAASGVPEVAASSCA